MKVWYCHCGYVVRRDAFREDTRGRPPRCTQTLHLREPRADYPYMKKGIVIDDKEAT